MQHVAYLKKNSKILTDFNQKIFNFKPLKKYH